MSTAVAILCFIVLLALINQLLKVKYYINIDTLLFVGDLNFTNPSNFNCDVIHHKKCP